MTKTKTTLDELAEQAPENVQKRYAEQKANGVVNPIVLAALLSVGSEDPVRPQMIYNYLRKGKFTEVEGAVGENSTQKKVINLDEANTFAKQYHERKTEREAKKAAKVEAELAGETVDA
jgi:hypothetical protein